MTCPGCKPLRDQADAIRSVAAWMIPDDPNGEDSGRHENRAKLMLAGAETLDKLRRVMHKQGKGDHHAEG